MAHYRLLALTNCLDGRDEEFNAWYDAHHLPQACAVPGVISGMRLERVGSFSEESDQPRFQYLAIYEVETEDADAFLATLKKYLSDGRIQRGQLYRQPTWTALYKVRD